MDATRTGQLFGAYRLLELIGRGGMGVVYRAEHEHLGRVVALKLLTPELSESGDFRERFLQESRVAASMDHPNIVTVYDAGEVNGALFIAMRFVQGTDLSALLRSEAPLSPPRTLAIVEQVGSALDSAHALGLVHRDVKPANIMIEGERCYLADFGLTKRISSTAALTAAGTFLGTVDYCAPEQIEGRTIDGRADVYALGCVLHECLTGSRPFPKDSEISIIYAHLQEPPPRPSQLRPELPVALDAVIATAMAKDPDARFANCSQLVAAAQSALGEPVTTASDRPTAARARPTLAATAAPATAASGARETAPSGARATAPAHPDGTVHTYRPGRRRGPAIAAGIGLLVVLAVAAVLALSGGGGGGKSSTGASSGGTSQPQVVGQPIPVGQRPFGVVVGTGVLWVGNASSGTVSRVSTANDVRTEIPTGKGAFGIAKSRDSVWVANSVSNTVTRIDTKTGLATKTVPVGKNPYFVSADANSVFVSNGGEASVTVLDARTGDKIGNPIPVDPAPRGIVSGGTAVWVNSKATNTVDRIVNGQVIKRIKVGKNPAGIAFSGNALWVANKDSNTVSRINLRGAGAKVKTIPVGKEPFGVTVGEGFVWVTNSGSDSVQRLDPKTGDPVGDPIPVAGQPVGIATGQGFVWVTANDRNALVKIKP